MSITLTGFRRMDLIDWVLEGGEHRAQSIIGDALRPESLSEWNIFVNCNLPSSRLSLIVDSVWGLSQLIFPTCFPNLFSLLFSPTFFPNFCPTFVHQFFKLSFQTFFSNLFNFLYLFFLQFFLKLILNLFFETPNFVSNYFLLSYNKPEYIKTHPKRAKLEVRLLEPEPAS